MKILISDITSCKSIIIARFIKKNYNSLIYSFDYRKKSKFFHTKYVDHHYVINKNNYIDEIIEIIEKNKIDLFLPTNNNNLEIILKNFNGKPYFNFYGSFESFDLLNDKSKLYLIAEKLQIQQPEKFNNIHEAKIPFIIKPKKLSSSKGVKYILNEAHREKVLSEIENSDDYVIQQYIKGNGVGYSGFSKEGNIQMGYGHKRIIEYPITGGGSVFRESFYNDEIKEVSEKLLKYTSWSGFFMFEFKLSDDNQIYLIESNPRIWGGINQGLVNNINYFEPLLGKIDLPPHKKMIRTYFSPLIYFSFFHYIINLKLAPVFKFILHFNSNKPDVSFFNDPLGWVSLFLKYEKN
ncbi:MAG: ATP-grasp domain-containing protein [Bacteroidales bacterium]|jgi:carbamoyl-phosphate synthase large subunit